ncbi:alpha/beta-hydrolase [Rhypophila decipiens]
MFAIVSKHLLAVGLAIPAVHGLWVGGGLTILTKNELDSAENKGAGAILVSQPSPYSSAKFSCDLLGEIPWNPDNTDFDDTLKAALGYQIYEKLAPKDQLYWVLKLQDADICRGIDATGEAHDIDCLSELPMLCTQSAPLSNSTFADNSVNWQVSQFVGNKLLTGYRDYHTWKFRGIRYADKPARFTYSKAASFESDGEVDATNAGADCSQPIGEVKNGSSEDCLFANVWTPYLPRMGEYSQKSQLKPVMLYLYGGGLTSGSGKNTNTDGTNLASRGDVVVVSVNYRVGTIGFLNLNDGVHNGNYALSDMTSALQWVNKYIKYFGGDPDRVTLFGESSGAHSTHMMLGVKKAEGLFHRAIMQSGPDGWPSAGAAQSAPLLSYPQYDTLQHNYETATKAVLKEAGCANAKDALKCLSKYSGFELVNMTNNVNGVVIDGSYLTTNQLIVNQTGLSYASNISIIAGFNRDEAGVQVDNLPLANSTFESYFAQEVTTHFNMPPNTNISSLYPLARYPGSTNPNFSPGSLSPQSSEIFNASMRIATDAVFVCYSLAKLYSGVKSTAFKSAYSYNFNRTYQTNGYTRPWCIPPKSDAFPNGDPSKEYFKCHAGEQMIVFGTERRAGRPDRDGLDVKFMQLIVDYWSWFARTGDPNPDERYLEVRGYLNTLGQVRTRGRWEKVTVQNPTTRILQWDGVQVPFESQEVCRALGAGYDSLEASR